MPLPGIANFSGDSRDKFRANRSGETRRRDQTNRLRLVSRLRTRQIPPAAYTSSMSGPSSSLSPTGSQSTFDSTGTGPADAGLPTSSPPAEVDRRLYVTDPATTRIAIKKSSEKGYCHHRFPGEPHFHLLMSGELYVARGDQKICITCALRLGYLTTNRLYWQTKQRGEKRPVV